HIIQSKRQIGELKFAKQRDGAKAAVGAAMQSYGNLAANGNTDAERSEAEAGFGTMIGQLRGVGFLEEAEKQAYLEQFRQIVKAGRSARFSVGLKGDLDGLSNQV